MPDDEKNKSDDAKDNTGSQPEKGWIDVGRTTVNLVARLVMYALRAVSDLFRRRH